MPRKNFGLFAESWPEWPQVHAANASWSFHRGFFVLRKKLIVEVDGSTHGEVHEIKHDAERTAFLESAGYRLFRCYNANIFDNLSGVLEGILLKLDSE